MVRFFHPAHDNQLTGTVTYLESLQRLFAQDEGSGIIELQAAPERVVMILMHSGRAVANFLVENEDVVRFDLVHLPRIWSGVTSPISYMQLSTQAVRAAWQALEWNSGRRSIPHGRSPLESLEALNAEKANGLLHLALPDLDGFVMLVDGQPLNLEAVLSTPRGFEESLPNLRGVRWSEGDCQAWLYPIQAGTLTGELAPLRLGIGAWCGGIVTGYQHLVGQSLTNALNYDLNTQLRLKRYNLHLVGPTLVDHHLFLALENATEAYRLLVQTLVAHMVLVVGAGLVRRTLADSYSRLREPYRKAMAGRGLTPEKFA